MTRTTSITEERERCRVVREKIASRRMKEELSKNRTLYSPGLEQIRKSDEELRTMTYEQLLAVANTEKSLESQRKQRALESERLYSDFGMNLFFKRRFY